MYLGGDTSLELQDRGLLAGNCPDCLWKTLSEETQSYKCLTPPGEIGETESEGGKLKAGDYSYERNLAKGVARAKPPYFHRS